MIGKSKNEGLIDKLYGDGYIRDERAIKVMKEVDRGEFIDNNPYQDRPQYLGYAATISAPHMHATALELLADHLDKAQQCLDVGSGTGYLTLAFLKMMQLNQKDKKVVSYGIEHIQQLVDQSIKNIGKSNRQMLDDGSIKIVQGDGREGLQQYGPFDCIHVGAAAETIPQPLIDQLNNGGRMVLFIYQVQVDPGGQVGFRLGFYSFGQRFRRESQIEMLVWSQLCSIDIFVKLAQEQLIVSDIIQDISIIDMYSVNLQCNHSTLKSYQHRPNIFHHQYGWDRLLQQFQDLLL